MKNKENLEPLDFLKKQMHYKKVDCCGNCSCREQQDDTSTKIACSLFKFKNTLDGKCNDYLAEAGVNPRPPHNLFYRPHKKTDKKDEQVIESPTEAPEVQKKKKIKKVPEEEGEPS